jgi:hypothetical protein
VHRTEIAARELVVRLRASQPYLEEVGRLDELEDQATLEAGQLPQLDTPASE